MRLSIATVGCIRWMEAGWGGRLKKQKSIFEGAGREITTAQIFAVAQMRMDDAEYLLKSKNNGRLNASMYLAGFVIECILKGLLLKKYSYMGKRGLDNSWDERLYSLIYRSHDLRAILDEMPELKLKLEAVDRVHQSRLLFQLQSICSKWRIQARYSPFLATRQEAKGFVQDVKELKNWLIEL